jgi:hypothetical protein
MHQLDVDILVERTGQPIAGTWKHAPASTVIRRAANGGIIRGVAEPEERKPLQRPIQQNDARRGASPRGEAHEWESDVALGDGQGSRTPALRQCD